MFPRTMFLCFLLFTMLLATTGCGGTSSNNCQVIGLNVAPPSATADHTALAPANGQTFAASVLFGGGSGVCTANTSVTVNSNWTVSDPSVQLSATQGFQVTATCTAALANPVTVTATAATGQPLTGKASLTCN